MREYLASQDWEADRKGFRTLNRVRLEDCFFTLADRFTSGGNASRKRGRREKERRVEKQRERKYMNKEREREKEREGEG